jgi:uncharacterized membrane protein (DUF106 family)
MWILSILSETAIHTIFGLGILGVIAGFVLGFIPFIKPYKLAIQVISILLLVFGVYLEGGLADQKEWELRVAEVKAKLAQAEAKSAEKNIEVQEKVVEKTKVVREKGQTIIKYLDREVIKNQEVVKFVENCPIPKEIIDLHNQAAELNKAAQGDKK